jgi:hypothetical protein
MEKRHINEPHPAQENALIENARVYALHLFNQNSDPRLVFHNFHQAAQVVQLVEEIGLGNNASTDQIQMAQVAAWLHNSGYLFDYAHPNRHSKELTATFLSRQSISELQKERILNCLEVLQQAPKDPTPEAALLLDAYHAQLYGTSFFEHTPLWKLELELIPGKEFSMADWTRFLFQHLLNVRFYTSFAKEKYEPTLAKNLLEQKEITEKNESRQQRDQLTDYRRFKQVERKVPTSGIQTFFRTNYRNHINLSAIADNKANIMISVNAILISVVISVVSYQNTTEVHPMVLMAALIFVMTGLCSLIFAVLSARPKVTNIHKKGTPDAEDRMRNIVFFGNFVHMKMEEYEEAMDAVFRDSELLYGNLSRDLYHLGKVLDKKYKYLSISYNIFMIGFAVTVLTFLVALLS